MFFLHFCPSNRATPPTISSLIKRFMADINDKQPEQKSGKFPRSIPFIVGNEAAERFNFYGMTAILTTFLIAHFYNPLKDPNLDAVAAATANAKTHDFKAMAYLLPMFGGMIADGFGANTRRFFTCQSYMPSAVRCWRYQSAMKCCSPLPCC